MKFFVIFQLEEWWLKYAYLQSRDSLIFSTNFSGHWINHSNLHLTLNGTEEHKRSTSMARLLHQLLQFWLLLRHQKVPPFQDSQGKKFTMHQFRFKFSPKISLFSLFFLNQIFLGTFSTQQEFPRNAKTN